MFETIMNMDGNALLWIQEHLRTEALNPVWVFITHLGDAGILWIGIILLFFVWASTRRTAVLMSCSMAFSALIDNIILKPGVARIRPYEVVDGLVCLIGAQKDFSFPSGHTGASFAVAVVMFYKLPKQWRIYPLVMAALIGFSRLYVGVHYPTDVMFGMLVGIFTATVTCKVEEKYFKDYKFGGLKR